jgi:hypothetical protein
LGSILFVNTFAKLYNVDKVGNLSMPHSHMGLWSYVTPVISTTVTVCPTSGSQIEGYNPFEYRTFAMEDGGLDRRQ